MERSAMRARFLSRWRVHLIVASLALGWTVLYVDRSILFPLLPVIGEEFGLSGVERGAISSAYFIVYVAMQIPSGVMGDRLGLRYVLTGMYLVIGAGLLGIGVLSMSYALLLVFVGLQGFGAGAFYAGSYGITISSVPAERRGFSSAIVTAGMALGSLLGLSLAGVLYLIADSWRVPYMLMLAPTILMAILLAAVIRGVPSAPVARGGFRYLLSNRSVVGLGVVNFCTLYAYMVVFSWGPSYLVERHGLSVTRAGLYISLVSATSIVGALLWGRLSDRFGRKRLTLLVLGTSAVMVSVIASVQSTPLLLVSLGVYGLFGSLAWNPVFVAWIGDHTVGSGRVGMGTVMGVMNTVGISAAFVSPVVSGWISDVRGSLSWGFYLAAIVQVAAALVALMPSETTARARRS